MTGYGIPLDTRAAAIALGCSTRTIQRYIERGLLRRGPSGSFDLAEIKTLRDKLDADQLCMS